MPTVGIVTGAGRGMGAACATRLAGMCDILLLVDRDERLLAEAMQTLAGGPGAGKLEAVCIDVTDRDGLQRLASLASERGTLRAVAHAAGVSPTMGDWRQVITVDLVGTAMLVEALAPIVTAGTAIVCFASTAPLLGFMHGDVDPIADAALDEPLAPDLLERLLAALGAEIEDSGMAYTWAKRGVLRLVQREAVRLGRRGARICSVSPGIIDTPMGRQEAAARPTNERLAKLTPLGREGRPEEVVAAVMFLLSDEASFINGIDLPVEGGLLAAIRTEAPDWRDGA